VKKWTAIHFIPMKSIPLSIIENQFLRRIIFSEAEKVLKKARKINPAANSLLDFGSGKGQFLAVAKTKGWKGLGIETARERANFAAEKYGVEVLSEFYESGRISTGDFDLITLNHVLEHLPEPIEVIKSLLEENLSPNGMVYIEVPRADSWQAQIAGENWIHWDIPRHLTHWTEARLSEQMRKIGFEMVEKRSFSIHLGVLGMLQALLSKFGFGENLILRLKRKKSLGLLLSIGVLLPFAWILELLSTGFGNSGILGIYLKRSEKA
jgi:SAM-dependent methyltransferase